MLGDFYPPQIAFKGYEIIRQEDAAHFRPLWFLVNKNKDNPFVLQFSSFEEAREYLFSLLNKVPASPEVVMPSDHSQVIVAQLPECICAGTGWVKLDEFDKEVPCPRCNPFMVMP